jgi:hypothetical protein
MFITATLSLNPTAPTEYVASDNEDEKPVLLEHETCGRDITVMQIMEHCQCS